MRRRTKRAKPGQVLVYYGHDEDGEGPDLCFAWGAGVPKGDAVMAMDAINSRPFGGEKLWQEFERRGYDLSTLQFTVQRKST